LSNLVFDIPEEPRRWPRLLWAASPLLPLLLVLGLAHYQAGFVFERALRLALGEGDLAHGWVLPGPDGRLGASDLHFRAAGGELVLQAARVDVDAGGWWWLLRNAVRRPRLEAPLAALSVRLHGVRGPEHGDPSLGELGPVGPTGAAFESAGCPRARQWDADTLATYDLADAPTELWFGWRLDGTTLESRVGFRREGSAQAERILRQRVPMRLSLLVVDQYPVRTESERWELGDLGFAAIRQKACGQRGDARALVERHLREVRVALGVYGIAPSEQAWSAYRYFVRDGGSLALAVTYPSPQPLDTWFRRPREPAALAGSTATFERDEAHGEFRPMAGSGDALPVVASKTAQTLSLAGTLWLAPERALVLLEPEPASAGQPAPAPAAPPARPAGIPEIVPAQPSNSPPRRLDWDDLPGRVGQRLRITTVAGGDRVVELVSVSAGEIVVRGRIGGGVVESRIRREMFRYAAPLE
jgi:hypothetical protein